MSTAQICLARDLFKNYTEAQTKDSPVDYIKMFALVDRNFDKITTEFEPENGIDINWGAVMSYIYIQTHKWQVISRNASHDETRMLKYLSRRLQHKFNTFLK